MLDTLGPEAMMSYGYMRDCRTKCFRQYSGSALDGATVWYLRYDRSDPVRYTDVTSTVMSNEVTFDQARAGLCSVGCTEGDQTGTVS